MRNFSNRSLQFLVGFFQKRKSPIFWSFFANIFEKFLKTFSDFWWDFSMDFRNFREVIFIGKFFWRIFKLFEGWIFAIFANIFTIFRVIRWFPVGNYWAIFQLLILIDFVIDLNSELKKKGGQWGQRMWTDRRHPAASKTSRLFLVE